jgi:large exoprotein involved in heme utilization and adhesion
MPTGIQALIDSPKNSILNIINRAIMPRFTIMSRFTMQKRSILALGFGLLGWCGFPVSLQAQVIPDGSLGSENSVVRSAVTVQGTIADLIEGGALRGSNLFHSFEELKGTSINSNLLRIRLSY